MNEGERKEEEGGPGARDDSLQEWKNLPRAGDFLEEQEIFLKSRRDDSNNP